MFGAEGWFTPELQIYAIRVNEYTQDLCTSRTPWLVGGYDEESLAAAELRATACARFLDDIEPTEHDGTEDRGTLTGAIVDEAEALNACPTFDVATSTLKPYNPTTDYRLFVSRFVDDAIGVELVVLSGLSPDCFLGRCYDYVFERTGTYVRPVGAEVVDAFGYRDGELALELVRFYGGNDATTYWAKVLKDDSDATVRLVEIP